MQRDIGCKNNCWLSIKLNLGSLLYIGHTVFFTIMNIKKAPSNFAFQAFQIFIGTQTEKNF